MMLAALFRTLYHPMLDKVPSPHVPFWPAYAPHLCESFILISPNGVTFIA